MKTRTLKLLQVGLGRVGSEIIEQLWEVRPLWRERFCLDVHVAALVRRQGGILRPTGLTDEELRRALLAKRQNRPITLEPNSLPVLSAHELVSRILPADDADLWVLIDATGADELGPVLESALSKGIHVVTANKKPLVRGLEEHRRLLAAAREGGASFLYETTVGAGLPLLKTLRALVHSGDQVREIQGCLSGTNNFLCACLEEGQTIVEAVRRAQELGYTEPDPREDVAGWDAARKALILARELGRPLELKDIEIAGFVPPEEGPYVPDRFYEQLQRVSEALGAQVEAARREGRVPRFLVTLTAEGCRVGLEFVAQGTPLGRLRGPENLVVFRTRRYDRYPLVIQGPGAGPEVTAAGVLRDLLAVAGVDERRSAFRD